MIVNYNSLDDVLRCVKSLRTVAEVREIFVLDNASPGGDAKHLSCISEIDRRVRVGTTDRNIGFGAGVNQAVTSLTSNWTHLWILNPDSIFVEGSLSRTLEWMAGCSVSICSPLVLGPGPDYRVWFVGGEIDLKRGVCTHEGFGDYPPPAAHTDGWTTNFVSGAACIVTRSAWMALNGFRDDLFLYWEDADLSYRARELGMNLGVSSALSVSHEENGSSRVGSGKSPVFYYYVSRNRVLLIREHNRRLGLILWRSYASSYFVRLVASALLKQSAFTPNCLQAVAKGAVDGLRGRYGPRS
ncbi:glycosyltransferase family 2 protein [Gordonia mangrovi]|uniref:glycosyltransferase family 2 protein n=1 Tax=Gordonia mangrovi TaxID=2665643 RepID=UPI00136B0CAC